MNTEDLLKQRMSNLLAKGRSVLATKHRVEYSTDEWVDSSAWTAWMVQSTHFIREVTGLGSVYETEFKRITENGSEFYNVKIAVSVLEALAEEIESGYLSSIRNLVSAEIFADIIEMAEYLLSEGYKDASASICGAALETGLRQILSSSGNPPKESDRLQALNQKCLTNNVFNKIRYNEIKTWTAIRDHAAHGEYADYDSEQVKRMVGGVRSLLSEYLG